MVTIRTKLEKHVMQYNSTLIPRTKFCSMFRLQNALKCTYGNVEIEYVVAGPRANEKRREDDGREVNGDGVVGKASCYLEKDVGGGAEFSLFKIFNFF